MANVAAVTYESSNTTAIAEGAITITKPTGLAVGDAMFVFLAFSNTDATPTPSGWTLVRNTSTDFNASTDGAIFYKIATSGDVAASNFSFDVTDTTGSLTGTLVRVSGVNQTLPFESVSVATQNANTTARSHTVSVTPTNATSIIFAFCSHLEQGALGPYSSTGSPTWTELSEQVAFSNNRVSVAYAPYTGTTTITNFSFTAAQSASGDLSDVILFVVKTGINSTDDNSFSSVGPSFFTQNGVADSIDSASFMEYSPSFFTQSGNVTTPTIWTNETKPSTTWINEEL